MSEALAYELASRLELFGERELTNDEVEQCRHDRGGVYQHCKRGNVTTLAEERDKVKEAGGLVAGEGRVEDDATEWPEGPYKRERARAILSWPKGHGPHTPPIIG